MEPCCKYDYDRDGNCHLHPPGWQERWMANDYQRPEGTPAPEGGTMFRTPFPGWLRNMGNGWLGRVNVRTWKANALCHVLDREERRNQK